MKITTYRLLKKAFAHQPDEDVDFHQSAGRTTHPGHLSPGLFYFMLCHKDLCNLLSPALEKHYVVEAGAGPGYFSIMASLLTGRSTHVLAIELDRNRYNRLNEWIESLITSCGYSRRSLPTVKLGDFTSDSIREFESAIRNRKILVYLNNFNGCLSGLDGPEQRLTKKLAECRVGTVVVALGDLFLTDLNWEEERYTVVVPNGDMSWTVNNTCSRKELTIYKYTKLDDDPRKFGMHRERNTSPKALRYSFLNKQFFIG